MKFRKLPVIFEAVQFTGGNFEELRDFCGTRQIPTDEAFDIDANQPYTIPIFNPIGTYLIPSEKNEGATAELWVDANKIWAPIEIGEWVVKDDLGFYPCKDEVIQSNNAMLTPDMEALLLEMDRPKTFGEEIVQLINKHSMERYSGTPDWILGNFLEMVLRQFDAAVMMRADWRGEDVDLPALNKLRGGREKEVPLIVYTHGQRNEIGIAKVKVTPGEVAGDGDIIGALPVFGPTPALDDSVEEELNEPKDEPQPSNRFDRYQQKGLTENG